MKILINEEEKNVILEMHSKEKKNKFVLEQATNTPGVDTQLQALLDNGSIRNGKVVQMNSTNPQLQYAIKQESTKTPGKFRYLFIDKRVGTFENGTFTFMKDTVWNPGQPTPKVDQNAEDIKQEIATNWKERKDLANVSDVDLYQLKSGDQGKQGGYTKEQEAWIKVWKNTTDPVTGQVMADVYKTSLTDEEKATQAFVPVIAPGSEKVFPNGGLTVYYNPNKVKTVTGSVLSTILANQTINKEACRKNVMDYYLAFTRRNSVNIPGKSFDEAKRIVQNCADSYYKKWGLIGSLRNGEGNSTLDKNIDILRGGMGGPSEYGDDAKWKLK